jgi:hypothetical protein
MEDIKIVDEIPQEDGWKFVVEIRNSNDVSLHQISLKRTTYESRLNGELSPSWFAKQSVIFLLKRESKESILSVFDIDDISKYFPDYPQLFLRQK